MGVKLVLLPPQRDLTREWAAGLARGVTGLQVVAPETAAEAAREVVVAHAAVGTNFREIYNDHIGAHILAFVLAFARGLHHYVPLQLRREWRPLPLDEGVVHLPEATALIL